MSIPRSLSREVIAHMPLYEYRCAECGEGFEKLVYSSGVLVCCPKCGSEEVRRLVSLFGTISSSSDYTGGCSTPAGTG